jgi:hypothetical protein
MLLHCTRALAKKLRSGQAEPRVSDPAWAAWHAHLLRLDRRQCVVFCHDQTRYCLFIAGLRAAHLADLGRWHRECFTASLAKEGVDDAAIARLELALGEMTWDTRTDRSVLSSMRVAVDDFRYGLLQRSPHVLLLDPLEVTSYINERPATIHGKWMYPREAMKTLVSRLFA